MTPNTIVSGIQPTGKLHIGNYLGALKHWVDLQNENPGRCLFFIADYHCMTNEETFKNYRDGSFEVAVELLAAGLDPKKAIVFNQHDVPEVTELCWMFNTVTPISFLERMTQFKDKAMRAKTINMGLMDYPVLQAADILIYGGTQVPVGEDQIQHVELTRDIARFWNNRFGETFIEPKPILTKTPRVMALSDPDKKMSKSIPGSTIDLADSPEEIYEKVKKAITDIGPKPATGMSPGVANLFELLAEFGPENDVKKFRKQYSDGTIKYVELKDHLANHIASYFADFRKRREALLKKPAQVEKIFAAGGKRARKVAQETMKKVRKQIGF